MRTWLHELQAANPQLGVHGVLDIARMQLQAAATAALLLVVRRRSFSRYGPGDPPHRLARPVFLLCAQSSVLLRFSVPVLRALSLMLRRARAAR